HFSPKSPQLTTVSPPFGSTVGRRENLRSEKLHSQLVCFDKRNSAAKNLNQATALLAGCHQQTLLRKRRPDST
ncbi:hypothetical protein BOX15_Mlig029036g2, partial [Macrostomum lignano]